MSNLLRDLERYTRPASLTDAPQQPEPPPSPNGVICQSPQNGYVMRTANGWMAVKYDGKNQFTPLSDRDATEVNAALANALVTAEVTPPGATYEYPTLSPLAKGSELLQRRIEMLGERLFQLSTDQADWSQKTFGRDSERGPMGSLRHLEKEAREAEVAWDAYRAIPDGPEFDAARELHASEGKKELADCLILILDASRRAGVYPLELLQAGIDKMAVNRSRTWPKAKDGEPCEHVK